ncbi:MAG: hypothetical protein MAG551_01204 [Candidatus Scalindua arabica]|uniref:Uncharacterized protein n=1 Tax=Candidatus Scalindua arabica TaxID=1127984 RepID=A0A942A218_9BACT|nr:hypothetical protein [Candidatus Scalindua arabica]
MIRNNRLLLITGILASILFISTFIFAKEKTSLFEDFNFPMGDSIEEFVTVSFDDLFNIFGNYSTLTDSQRKDSWREYKDKYVRWEGIVNYKGSSKDDWNRVGIRHNVDTNVELIFYEDKKDIVKVVRKGDSITYTGKLSSLFDRDLLFRLEDANIETINGTTVEDLNSKLMEDATLALQSSQATETSTDPESGKPPEGEIILSYDGLNKIFGKQSSVTQARKEELWENYRGEYIRWQGIVNYKGFGMNDWNRAGIRHTSGTNVELRFDEDKKYLVEMIKREDNITYTGKLAELFGRNLLCAIEDVDIERIGDKAITEIIKATSAASDDDSATVDAVEEEVIKEPEVIMAESMAPEIIQKEDLEIIETPEGFINISFNELDEIFGKENKMTESQKDTLWEEYNNKNIKWTGEVLSRGKGRVTGLRMGIKHKKGTDVELIFDDEKEESVLETEKGDKITYTGRLVTRRGYILPYKLEDGNIESVVKAQPATED